MSCSPIARAFAFIHETKSGTSPSAAAAASASAASFALWISAPLSRSRTVICWPARRGIRSSPTRAACAVTVTVSEGLRCFSATITVISFVMLAIGTGESAFEEASTSPFAPLTTYQAVASGCGGAAPAGAADTASTATATAARTSSRRIRRGPYLTRSF